MNIINKLGKILNKTFYDDKIKDFLFKTLLVLTLIFSPLFFLCYGIKILFTKSWKEIKKIL